MTALVWTRSASAREMVSLALSRASVPVRLVDSRASVHAAVVGIDEEIALVLGPTFTDEEAEELGAALAAHVTRLRIVLLEDLVKPLPCRVIVPEAPHAVLTMPVRIRPLLQAVRGPRDEQAAKA